MSKNMPESDVPDIREYLFVDNARIRMLLAQFQGGAPETTKQSTSRSHKLMLGLKALGAEKGRSQAAEDTIALSDLHVSMLEEDAEALGMLKDLSEESKDQDFWKRGGARKRLKAGMLARVTAPTQLIDPHSITQVWQKFNKAFSSDEPMSQALDGITSLYGEHLALNVLPLGLRSPTKAFVGVIDHRTDFATLDRASLFSRLGPDPTELTTIMQIARIPQEEVKASSQEQLLKEFKASSQQAIVTGRLDRSALDQFLTGLMKMTEEYGLQAAPLWPSMAITPLAIYRHMPAFETENL
jgi:hypothetical protein